MNGEEDVTLNQKQYIDNMFDNLFCYSLSFPVKWTALPFKHLLLQTRLRHLDCVTLYGSKDALYYHFIV